MDYELTYVDLSKRLQKGIQGFYNAYYFIAQNPNNGEIVRTRNPYKFIGGTAFAAYPLNRYYRLEGSVGFLSRKYDGYPVWVNGEDASGTIFIPTENNFPTFGGKLVGDTTSTWSSADLGPPDVARPLLRAVHGRHEGAPARAARR